MTAAGKAALESASRPPIQLVIIGADSSEIKIGNETQLYRHEEKFHRPAAVAVRVSDTLDDDALARRAEAIGKLAFDRVGTRIRVNLVAVDNESGSAERLEKAVKLAAEKSGLACLVMSAKAANLQKAAAALAGRRPLLYISDPAEAEAAARTAKQHNCPLAIRADGLDALAELTAKISAQGVEQIVLDPGTRALKATLEALTKIRRLALKNFRPLGYPAIAFATNPDPTDAGGRGQHLRGQVRRRRRHRPGRAVADAARADDAAGHLHRSAKAGGRRAEALRGGRGRRPIRRCW